jgi:hypothetical protein
MKKSTVFKIVIVIFAIFIIGTAIYRVYQVNSFQKNLRDTTLSEKQQIIGLLNQNIDTSNYQIIFGKVITHRNERLVQVQLKKDNIRKIYSINLENNSLVRNKNEQ